MNNLLSKYKIGGVVLGLALSIGLTSCDDMFKPAIENHLGFEYMYDHPDYADGLLGNAYTRLPNGSYSFNDVATDDAVSNDATDSYRKMTGVDSWTSSNNPVETWRNCRAAIQYINLFLANVDKVNWNSDEVVRAMYEQRYIGEAKGLRALFMYYLLRAHGGLDANGKLLGVPNDLVPTNVSSDFNSLEVRASYADCMKQLIADAEEAVRVLPVDYKDTDNETMTVSCLGKSYTVTKATYNRVLGTNFAGRLSGRIARAVLAQATLMAASPAFASGSGVTYEQAAQYAKAVLDLNGGISGIDTNGLEWYADPNMKDLTAAECPKEVLWRTEKSENNDLETKYYPPSIYGQGRINPTQNLVDAFPAANGYPITDAKSEYDPANPYANRDPRLAKYIIYNGQTAGSGNAVINTQADNATNLDGLNKDVSKSTRTGYYLKKLLHGDVDLTSKTKKQGDYHTWVTYRLGEFYLNYAEAVFKYLGSATATSADLPMSADEAVDKIRKRAGMPDFPTSLSNEEWWSKYQNERMVELAFEGHRFWDVRRWKEADKFFKNIQEMKITKNEDGSFNYTRKVVNRGWNDKMYFFPISKSELLKHTNPEFKQNPGWE